MSDKNKISYRVLSAFHCAFCRQQAEAIEFVETQDYGVLHVVPHCAEFLAMDPLTFLTECRKKLQDEAAKNQPN